jgi:hypothetical protein
VVPSSSSRVTTDPTASAWALALIPYRQSSHFQNAIHALASQDPVGGLPQPAP